MEVRDFYVCGRFFVKANQLIVCCDVFIYSDQWSYAICGSMLTSKARMKSVLCLFFLRLGVSNSYFWMLVFFRLGVRNFFCLRVSFLTFGVRDSYVSVLVFLRLGVSFLTFGG